MTIEITEKNQKIKRKINRSLVVCLLVASVIFSSIFYAFLINDIVRTVVARSEVERKIATLNSKMSGLESKYLGLKDTVTLELAYSKGFTEVSVSKFISRRQFGKGLSVNNEI